MYSLILFYQTVHLSSYKLVKFICLNRIAQLKTTDYSVDYFVNVVLFSIIFHINGYNK